MAVAERHWSLNTTLDSLERWFRELFPLGGLGKESAPPILATQARVLAYNDGDDFVPIPREATPSYGGFGGVGIEWYAPLERPGVAEALFYLPSVEHIDTHRRLLRIDAFLLVRDPVLVTRSSTSDAITAIELDCRGYPHPGRVNVTASCLDWARPRFDWLVERVEAEWPGSGSVAGSKPVDPAAIVPPNGLSGEVFLRYQNIWRWAWQRIERGDEINQVRADLAKAHPNVLGLKKDTFRKILKMGRAGLLPID